MGASKFLINENVNNPILIARGGTPNISPAGISRNTGLAGQGAFGNPVPSVITDPNSRYGTGAKIPWFSNISGRVNFGAGADSIPVGSVLPGGIILGFNGGAIVFYFKT